MKNKRNLSIIIRADVSAESFGELIRITIASIAGQPDFKPDAGAVLITDTCSKSVIEKACAEALDSVQEGRIWEAVAADDLEKAVKGSKYQLFMDAGDELREDSSASLKALTNKGEYGVIFLTRKRAKSKKKESRFRSCGIDTTPPLFLPRGILIRSDIQTDVCAMAGRGFTPCVELVKCIMRSKGYYAEFDAGYREGTNAGEYTLDADMVKALMDFTGSEFSGGITYAEKCVLDMIGNKTDDADEIPAIKKCLALVHDKTVLQSDDLNFHEKRHLLNLKYGEDIMKSVEVNDDGGVIWNGFRLFNVADRQRCRYTIINIKDDKLEITGSTDLNMLGDDYRMFISEDNGNRIYLDLLPDPVRNIKTAGGELLHEAKQFEVTLPLRDKCDFQVVLEDADGRQIVLNPRMGKFSHIVDWNVGAYYARNGYIIKPFYGKLCVEKTNRWKNFKAECRYMKKLLRMRKPKVVLMRLAHFIYHLGQRKPVWLVADRPHIANDNGEHFFKYLMASDLTKTKDIRFVLQKESRDYPRLRAIGPVLDYGSFAHKMKYFEAQKIISAAANDLETKLLGGSQGFYRNLVNFDFVYLRHGVAKDDQSKWLNKQNKNIRILLSTSTREHDAIIAGTYGYTAREVKLTGLPRYDNLYDERQNKITILPTWRKNIEGGRIKGSAEREYILDFKDTEYCRFYNALINDERLLASMRKHGFTGSFYLHPVLEKQSAHFKGNDIITVGNTVADYQTVFRESSIMVTDFSSVAFDFAYLKKPLIYSQFDEATFYQDHSWDRGYFTYREDGFGPVTNTVEETVDALIHYMENGCQMEDVYVNRVEEFFPYTDRNNCKRVLEAVMETEE